MANSGGYSVMPGWEIVVTCCVFGCLCVWMAAVRKDSVYGNFIFGALLSIVAIPVNIYLTVKSGRSGALLSSGISGAVFLIILGSQIIYILPTLFPSPCSDENLTLKVRELMKESKGIETRASGFDGIATISSAQVYECEALYTTVGSDSSKQQMIKYRLAPMDGSDNRYLITLH